MTPVVVCYFPGAGGVRLVNYLAGLNYRTALTQSFHQARHTDPDDLVRARLICMPPHDGSVYATISSVIAVPDEYPITCTHCMSTPIVAKHYPGRKIIKIKSNLLTSLARCWQLEGQYQHQKTIQTAGSSMAILNNSRFHCEYYTETGVDWSADQIFDLDNSTDEFSVFMRDLMPVTVSQEYLSILDQQPELKAALDSFK